MGEANLAPAGKKQRILYFDALETLAIFLVVSVHNVWLRGTVASSIAMALCQLAVPVFFMVHGALLLNKPFDMKRHLHRMAKTTLQLIAWMLIYFVIARCCGWSTGALSRNLLYQYFINGGIMSAGLGGSLWFMFALLQIYLLFPVLHRIWNSDKKIACYAAILLFVVSFVRKEISIWGTWLGDRLFGSAVDLNWWLDKVSPFGAYANCIFFFLAGAMLTDLLQRLAAKAIFLKQDIYIYYSDIAYPCRCFQHPAGAKAAIWHHRVQLEAPFGAIFALRHGMDGIRRISPVFPDPVPGKPCDPVALHAHH